MTQPRFPSSAGGLPYAGQTAPYPLDQSYDPVRRTSLSMSGVGAPLQGGGAPLPAGQPGWSTAAQAAYGGAYAQHVPQAPPAQGHALSPAGYAPSYQPQQPFPPSVTSPTQPSSPFPTAPSHPYHPQAPPQRASTLPTAPSSHPYSHSHPQPASIDPAVAAAMQAHYRTLVAHYWSYAQQGFSAPLTAEPGSEERERQVKARKEAVDWARQVGIAVQDAADEVASPLLPEPRRERAGSRPLPFAPAAGAEAVPPAPATRERTASRPLPVTPVSGAASSTVPSVPATYRPASPTKASQQQQGLGRSVSLANPPSPAPVSPSTGLARSVSEALPRSTTPLAATVTPGGGGKRPLPIPPPVRSAPVGSSSTPASTSVAQLESGLSSIFISISAPQPPPPRSASPAAVAVPTISLPDTFPSPSTSLPTAPAIPTFSFGSADGAGPEDDEEDDDTYVPSAPAVPTFSFGGPGDEDDDSAAPSSAPDSTPTRPVLHPRHDPSHPSHHLYHPTSVSSPLSPPTSTSSGSLSSLSHSAPEAGTITCTSCLSPIFGRVLLALDREWHPGCFVCAERGCGVRLEVMEFEGTPEEWDQHEEEEEGSGGSENGESEEEDGEGEEGQDSSEEEEGWVKAPRVVIEEDDQEEGKKRRRRRRVRRGESLKGKAWCMVHFEERFALHCHHCHTPIASADYLPITDPLLSPSPSSSSSSTTTSDSPPKAKTRYYHPLHFFCAGCGDTFIDPVAYERTLHPSTNSSPNSSSPAGLEVKPYFAREGHPYCEKCDLRMWRPKCPGCRKGVREEDGFLEVPVAQGEEGAGEEGAEGKGEAETQKWHEGCFKCSMCTRPLTSIYLLRLDPVLIPRTRKQGGGFEEVLEERPYCAECYDVRAKEEAEEALAKEREGERA